VTYSDEVDAQVARNEGSGGWERGPLAICQEAAEEAIDIAAWLRGLDGYPMTGAQLDRIERVVGDSRLIWEELRELAQTFREPMAGEAVRKAKGQQ
jgi:hypothetical protein